MIWGSQEQVEGYGFKSLWIWRGRKGSRGEAAESVSGEASAGDGEGGAGRVRQDAGTKAALNIGK